MMMKHIPRDRDMGVGRISRKTARPRFLKKAVNAYRRAQMPERRSPQTATQGYKIAGVIVVAIIAVGLIVGWMRTFLFAR